MSLLDSKKGQVINYILVVILLFVFGVFAMFAAVIQNEMNDQFNATGYYTGAVETAGNQFFNALTVFDYIIVLIAVVLIIVIGLSSYRLNASAAFYIISFILAPILGLVSFFFNYMFVQIVSNEAFDAIVVFFPRTMLLCTNLHWIALLAFIVGSITLYAKKNKEEVMQVGPQE